MKRELTQIKTQLGKVTVDVANLKTQLGKVTVEVANLKGDMAEVKDTLKTSVATKDDISRVIAHIQAIIPVVRTAREDRDRASDLYMKHQDRLDEHERRLARLEAKKA